MNLQKKITLCTTITTGLNGVMALVSIAFVIYGLWGLGTISSLFGGGNTSSGSSGGGILSILGFILGIFMLIALAVTVVLFLIILGGSTLCTITGILALKKRTRSMFKLDAMMKLILHGFYIALNLWALVSNSVGNIADNFEIELTNTMEELLAVGAMLLLPGVVVILSILVLRALKDWPKE